MSIELDLDFDMPFSVNDGEESTIMMFLWVENRITEEEFQNWITKDLELIY